MNSDVTRISPGRKNRRKFTTSTKVTVTALSVLSFIGGWDLIARLENQDAQADALPSTPAPALSPTAISLPATPWPTIPPLAELPPIPTLLPTLTTFGQIDASIQPLRGGDSSVGRIELAPLPVLAPLPTLAPLPPMPAPPPPPAPAGGGGNRSGGS